MVDLCASACLSFECLGHPKTNPSSVQQQISPTINHCEHVSEADVDRRDRIVRLVLYRVFTLLWSALFFVAALAMVVAGLSAFF